MHQFVCLLHSQVFAPYVFLHRANASVGNLALTVTCVTLCALSLSPCTTYLFVSHLCRSGPDTGFCQHSEESSGNWCTSGEGEMLKPTGKMRESWTDRQQEEGIIRDEL